MTHTRTRPSSLSSIHNQYSSSVNVPIPASSGVITSGGYSIGAWNGTNWLFVASGSNAYGPKVTLV